VDAQTTLAQAQPTLSRLREARDWPSLDARPCAYAVGPGAPDIRSACSSVSQFLMTYPNSPHAQELHAVLDPAEQRAAAIEARTRALEVAQGAARTAEDERRARVRAAEDEALNRLTVDELIARCESESAVVRGILKQLDDARYRRSGQSVSESVAQMTVLQPTLAAPVDRWSKTTRRLAALNQQAAIAHCQTQR